jgi:hypothetical protein
LTVLESKIMADPTNPSAPVAQRETQGENNSGKQSAGQRTRPLARTYASPEEMVQKISAAVYANPSAGPRCLVATARNAQVVLVSSTLGTPMTSIITDLDRIMGVAERQGTRGFDAARLNKKNMAVEKITSLFAQLAAVGAEIAHEYQVQDLRDQSIKNAIAENKRSKNAAHPEEKVAEVA